MFIFNDYKNIVKTGKQVVSIVNEQLILKYYKEVIKLARELNNKLVQQSYKDFDSVPLTAPHES